MGYGGWGGITHELKQELIYTYELKKFKQTFVSSSLTRPLVFSIFYNQFSAEK